MTGDPLIPSPTLHAGIGVGGSEDEKPCRTQPPAKAIVRVLLDRRHVVLRSEAGATNGPRKLWEVVHERLLGVLHEVPQRADP